MFFAAFDNGDENLSTNLSVASITLLLLRLLSLFAFFHQIPIHHLPLIWTHLHVLLWQNVMISKKKIPHADIFFSVN